LRVLTTFKQCLLLRPLAACRLSTDHLHHLVDDDRGGVGDTISIRLWLTKSNDGSSSHVMADQHGSSTQVHDGRKTCQSRNAAFSGTEATKTLHSTEYGMRINRQLLTRSNATRSSTKSSSKGKKMEGLTEIGIDMKRGYRKIFPPMLPRRAICPPACSPPSPYLPTN
jgi:hypothetical protein